MSPDAVPSPLARAAVAIAEPGPDGSDELRTRQCGRCRMMFDGDPTLDVRARDEWCLCPSCDAILLPGRARGGEVVALRRPAQASDEG